ncbi:MAG: HEPN domain-containing protein [Armatimonadota bacterium]|nr:HEPN domain-containing protein [Armatimonadota bacterium]
MSGHEEEIAANLERAEESLRAAKDLADGGYYDIAASRAYYAAFYAAKAALLAEGLDSRKHSGVIASVHQHLVKTGRLDREQGQQLNWLFGLRNVGDYGVIVHVSPEEAKQAIEAAESFVAAIGEMLPG